MSTSLIGDGWGNGYAYNQFGKALSIGRDGNFAGAPPQQAVTQVQQVYYDSRNRPSGTNTNDFQLYLPSHMTKGITSIEITEFAFPVPPVTPPPDYVNLCIDKMPILREAEPDSFVATQVYNNFESSYTSSLLPGQMSGPQVEHTPQSGVTLQVELKPIVSPTGTTDVWTVWKMGKGQRAIMYFPKENINRMRVRITDYKGNLIPFDDAQYVRLIMEVVHK